MYFETGLRATHDCQAICLMTILYPTLGFSYQTLFYLMITLCYPEYVSNQIK